MKSLRCWGLLLPQHRPYFLDGIGNLLQANKLTYTKGNTKPCAVLSILNGLVGKKAQKRSVGQWPWGREVGEICGLRTSRRWSLLFWVIDEQEMGGVNNPLSLAGGIWWMLLPFPKLRNTGKGSSLSRENNFNSAISVGSSSGEMAQWQLGEWAESS